MTTTQNIASKAAVAFVAVAMAFSLVAPAAKAQDVSSMSLEQLVALVNQLQAQLSGSTGSTGSCSYTFTRSLSQGSTGADVMNLQKFLNMSTDTQVSVSGAGAPGMETSYYGPATAAAVSKFQTKYSADILVPVGLSTPTGYFGPSSMAKANALCGSMTDGDDDDDDTASGDLEGGAGSIEETDIISSLSNEEVGEGDEDVEVAALEIEADDGSDIEITAMKIDFDDEGTANNDDDFDEYASEVSIWFGGEEVARVDADEFDDDNAYGKTISLDEGVIIRAGETDEITVAISGLSNIDSASVGDSWDIDFEQVRFRDGQGSTITETVTEDPVTFTFEDFATASDLEFKVTAGDDEINDSRSIEVSSTTETDGVEILSFNVEVEGNSDVTIDDLPVDFTAVGAGVGQLIQAAEIVVDGDVVGSENVTSSSATTTTVTFDNLNWEVGAGDTVEVIVRVDMREMTGSFTAGDTLMADVNPDDAGWDVEDEEGETLSASDKTGSATSEAHAFYADGIQVTLSSVDEEVVAGDSADDDYVKLTIKFDVTSFGETAYVDKTADQTGSTTAGTSFGVDLSTAAGTYIAAASSSYALSSTGDEETNGFEVREGETETFTLVVTVQNAATSTFDGKFVRAVLTSIGFNDDDSTTFTNHTSGLADTFKTDFAFISN